MSFYRSLAIALLVGILAAPAADARSSWAGICPLRDEQAAEARSGARCGDCRKAVAETAAGVALYDTSAGCG